MDDFPFRIHWMSHFILDFDRRLRKLLDSTLPNSYNELIDKYHRRHPRSPRPPSILITTPHPFIFPNNSDLNLDSTSHSDSVISQPETTHTTRSSPPTASRCPTSPNPIAQNFRANYQTAPQTTTRSGRISKPASRLDPKI